MEAARVLGKTTTSCSLERREKRKYKCPECKWWHLTSMENYTPPPVFPKPKKKPVKANLKKINKVLAATVPQPEAEYAVVYPVVPSLKPNLDTVSKIHKILKATNVSK